MTMPPANEIRPGVASSRTVMVLAVLVSIMACHRTVSVARNQLPARHDLAYEGPQVATIRLLHQGANPYSFEVFNEIPFTMTFYTPLYHAVVALLPESRNIFLPGRIVSLGCMAVAGGCILFFGRRDGRAWALLAAACFFLFWPASTNAAFVKTDSMALAFSAGCIAVLHMWRSPAGAICGALCATAAIISKQSYLAASLAGFVFLWQVNRRHALVFAATEVGALGILAVAGHLLLGAGLWVSLGGHTSHPMSLGQAAQVLGTGLSQPLVCGVVGVSLIGVGACLGRRPPCVGAFSESPAFVYAAVTIVGLLATVGKEGSSTNYLLEPFVSLCMLVAWMPIPPLAQASESTRAFVAAVLAACGLWDCAAVPRSAYDMTGLPWNQGRDRLVHDRTNGILRETGPDPEILNLASAGITAELPGRVSLSDPLFQLLMYDASTLSIRPLITAVAEQRFDAIAVWPEIIQWFSARGGPVGELIDTLTRSYRPVSRSGDVMVWLPRTRGDHGIR